MGGDALARLGFAIPLVVVGVMMVCVAGYLGLAVIDVANEDKDVIGSCRPTGPVAFLGEVAVLGACAIVAAGLVPRSAVASSTWWSLITLALALGIIPIAFSLLGSGRCPMMN